MDVKIEPGWKAQLQEEFNKDYFIKLSEFVKNEYNTQRIFPPGKLIFNAFNQCTFENLKVVILGQDPYHGPGQAHGLCFSVNDGIAFPPSLRNIFKELNQDMGKPIPETGNLIDWAKQGVLLLNATLTVRAQTAGSHQKKGWEIFTDAVIQKISSEKENVVFLLWGNYAISKSKFIDQNKHLVLTSVHPSPLSASRGFFGNKHFSRTNEFLISKGLEPIKW
ncbi:uracil-DNA glycosylase [Prolixibacteraceae bacterium Z1-6]|uniref:Uracil-DNA glycosylase n=1 Tax=Draconibacterium aestuarii TaxID=2998507 RepID=A0A9X3J775_9BACT|nr:uracil-DNA glycosylase [Prolixibacteraceae bacterium Z1-6]